MDVQSRTARGTESEKIVPKKSATFQLNELTLAWRETSTAPWWPIPRSENGDDGCLDRLLEAKNLAQAKLCTFLWDVFQQASM